MGIGITGLILLLRPTFLLSVAEQPVLTVKARMVRQDDGHYQCLVNLVNQSSKATLENVTVTIFADHRARLSLGPINLVPGQATVLQQNIDEEKYCSDAELFFRVNYAQQGVTHDLIMEGQANRVSAFSVKGFLGQTIPWTLGLLSAIVGGWLTHRLTLLREREKDRVGRATKEYDALVPAFREFLQAWGANPVPDMLQVLFSELERKVIPSPAVVKSYRETYKVLADPVLPMDRKREAATDLDRCMRAYVKESDVSSAT